jgi:hypothetical protein
MIKELKSVFFAQMRDLEYQSASKDKVIENLRKRAGLVLLLFVLSLTNVQNDDSIPSELSEKVNPPKKCLVEAAADEYDKVGYIQIDDTDIKWKWDPELYNLNKLKKIITNLSNPQQNESKRLFIFCY